MTRPRRVPNGHHNHPDDRPNDRRRPRPPVVGVRTGIAVGGIGAALFLWGTSGWHPLTLAVALAVILAAALALRGLRALLPDLAARVPRGAAGLAGLAALIATAPAPWPVLVVMGLALAGVTLHPHATRYRAPLWVAAALVATAGAVGIAVASLQEQASIEAEGIVRSGASRNRPHESVNYLLPPRYTSGCGTGRKGSPRLHRAQTQPQVARGLRALLRKRRDPRR